MQAIKDLFGIDTTELKRGVVVLAFDIDGKSMVYGRSHVEGEQVEDFDMLTLLANSFLACMNANSEVLATIVEEAHTLHAATCPHCSEAANEAEETPDYDEHCTHQGSKTLQ